MSIRPYKNTHPKIHASTYVDESAAVIGDVQIGADSSIWPMCVVRGDVNRIRIGARTNIQDGTVIHVTREHPDHPTGHITQIGDDVTVGHQVILHGCTIENQCLVGMGSIVHDGVLIRSQVLLGAGSLVTAGKELEGGFLWLGRPAKKIRPLTEQELAWFEESARHYVELKNDYRQ